jgi:hypothetical protein
MMFTPGASRPEMLIVGAYVFKGRLSLVGGPSGVGAGAASAQGS